MLSSADYKVGDLSALLGGADHKAKPCTLFDKPQILTKPAKLEKKSAKKKKVSGTESSDSEKQQQQKQQQTPDENQPSSADGSEKEPPGDKEDSKQTTEQRPSRTMNKHALKKRKRRELAEVEAREAEVFDGEEPGKRKKKKAEAEEESEEEGEEEKETEKKKPREESPTRLARTLFVGNLPPDAKRRLKPLKRLFTQFGPLDSVRIRGFVAADPKISKRVSAITGDLHGKVKTLHGYVVFQKAEDAEKAKSLDGTVFAERHLKVDSCSKESPNSKLSVFVGNLPFDVSDEALHHLFNDSCGDVASVRVIRDSASRMGKGFGYVAFRSMGAVVAAVKASETLQLDGRALRIRKATAKPGVGGSNKTGARSLKVFSGDAGVKKRLKNSDSKRRGKTGKDGKKKKKKKK